MIRKHKGDIELTPHIIYVNDIYGAIQGQQAATIHPYGYYGLVEVTPVVIVKLLQWAKRQGYLSVNGDIFFVSRTKLERI
jgi:hypothetical protein